MMVWIPTAPVLLARGLVGDFAWGGALALVAFGCLPLSVFGVPALFMQLSSPIFRHSCGWNSGYSLPRRGRSGLNP